MCNYTWASAEQHNEEYNGLAIIAHILTCLKSCNNVKLSIGILVYKQMKIVVLQVYIMIIPMHSRTRELILIKSPIFSIKYLHFHLFGCPYYQQEYYILDGIFNNLDKAWENFNPDWRSFWQSHHKSLIIACLIVMQPFFADWKYVSQAGVTEIVKYILWI